MNTNEEIQELCKWVRIMASTISHRTSGLFEREEVVNQGYLIVARVVRERAEFDLTVKRKIIIRSVKNHIADLCRKHRTMRRHNDRIVTDYTVMESASFDLTHEERLQVEVDRLKMAVADTANEMAIVQAIFDGALTRVEVAEATGLTVGQVNAAFLRIRVNYSAYTGREFHA